MTHSKSTTLAAAVVAVALTAVDAEAGGFALRERSAHAQGASFAGSTAAAGDVSYALFNPAALSTVAQSEFSGSLSAIIPAVEGDVVGGGQRNISPGVIGALPAMAVGTRIADDITIGLGLHSPFGLTTDYDDNFVGAADALRSELITIAATGLVAWEVTDSFAIGFGGSLIYNDPQLTSAVGVDANGNVQEAKLNATHVSYAGSIGALWDVTDTTRLGIAAHSGYDIDTDGILSAFAANGAPVDLPGDAKISLPWSVSVGFQQEITSDIRLLGEFEFANWSDFSEIAVDVPALAPNNDIGEVTDYKDSIFVALGLEYDWSDDLTLRTGVAYDQTPTKRASRSARVPDANRIWASLGFTYRIDEAMAVNAGYSAVFFENTDLTIMNGPNAGTVIEYGGVTHILAIGGSIKF